MGYYISKGFFDTISKQIDEAAMVDGATRFQIFYKITLPLSKPIVVYTILTAFMGPWAEFITAKYMMRGGVTNGTSGGVVTVAPQLFDMLDEKTNRSQYFGQFCAGAILVAVPTSLLFIALQKNYVSGVTGGAVKG
jgi:arabinogalactan oligomer/maltooligosaccharide transport system permease protein